MQITTFARHRGPRPRTETRGRGQLSTEIKYEMSTLSPNELVGAGLRDFSTPAPFSAAPHPVELAIRAGTVRLRNTGLAVRSRRRAGGLCARLRFARSPHGASGSAHPSRGRAAAGAPDAPEFRMRDREICIPPARDAVPNRSCSPRSARPPSLQGRLNFSTRPPQLSSIM
jgi:hypothetical protein